MAYAIEKTQTALLVELRGGVTARQVGELGRSMAAEMGGRTRVVVEAGEVEDIDTSVLQLLVSVRKTAASFSIEHATPAMLAAIDRAALRRELLAGAKEGV